MHNKLQIILKSIHSKDPLLFFFFYKKQFLAGLLGQAEEIFSIPQYFMNDFLNCLEHQEMATNFKFWFKSYEIYKPGFVLHMYFNSVG